MSRYTYTLKPVQKEPEMKQTYKRSRLEQMTTFQLKEICRKERLVLPSGVPDREELVRLIMRFRGQKDYRHIEEGREEGLARIQAFLDKTVIGVSNQTAIRIPGTITVFRGTGLNEFDGYRIEADANLYEGNLLLVDETDQVYTCFYIKEKKRGFFLYQGPEVPILPLEKHQYFIVYFPDERISEFLYDCYSGNRATEPGHVEGVRIPLLDLQVKEVTETALPLVIDFGSSNTTMGICLPDGSTQIARAGSGHVIPSVIGVTGMPEGTPSYAFGYAAVELGSQNYQDEDVPVFHDIKRWVSDAGRSEGVILKNGHKYQIARKEMLKAFLEHLINLGMQQFKVKFKNIQLLAPIRQKEKFETLFKELLPEYQVDCTLDEGMAVLFNSINSLISQGNYQKGRWYRALVIDCGGGTTDLTSGRFRIDNSRVSYTVDVETSYENGDTNFGGNNLTFRILQLLKVRISQALGYLKEQKTPASGGRGQGALEELYERAEAILPTRFRGYEERSRVEYFLVKNNYYYLFELAEQIKKVPI